MAWVPTPPIKFLSQKKRKCFFPDNRRPQYRRRHLIASAAKVRTYVIILPRWQRQRGDQRTRIGRTWLPLQIKIPFQRKCFLPDNRMPQHHRRHLIYRKCSKRASPVSIAALALSQAARGPISLGMNLDRLSWKNGNSDQRTAFLQRVLDIILRFRIPGATASSFFPRTSGLKPCAQVLSTTTIC